MGKSFGKAAPAGALVVSVVGLLAAGAIGPGTGAPPAPPIIGVKIYERPGSVPALFARWKELGINTAFVSAVLGADPEFKALARKNGVMTFLIFPVLFGGPDLDARPERYAVRADGTRAEDEWVKFACPTRSDHRSEKLEELRRAVREVDPDVLSLDFCRFFVFWEKVYPDRAPESLPDTCFDDLCLASFEREMDVALPAGLEGTAAKAGWIKTRHAEEWAEWKCRTVAGLVRELAAEARRLKPDIKVNIHTVPWRRDDFGGAGRAVAGQDLERLGPLVDLVSPMAYHHMVRRTPEWVHSVTLDAFERTGGRVLPSIQVDKAYVDDPYTADEFRRALDEALKPPSAGVVLWSWDALDKSPERAEALRAVAGPRPSR